MLITNIRFFQIYLLNNSFHKIKVIYFQIEISIAASTSSQDTTIAGFPIGIF